MLASIDGTYTWTLPQTMVSNTTLTYLHSPACETTKISLQSNENKASTRELQLPAPDLFRIVRCETLHLRKDQDCRRLAYSVPTGARLRPSRVTLEAVFQHDPHECLLQW